MVGYRVGGCRLRRSYHASFIALMWNNRGGEAAGLHRCGKKCSKKRFYVTSDSSCGTPYTSWDTTTVSKTSPMIAMGCNKAQGLKENPSVGSEPPKATRVRDEATQGRAHILAHPVPQRGDPASSSFIFESRPGGFLHAPPCELASSRPRFLCGLTGKEA
jgi:hypothetical protein